VTPTFFKISFPFTPFSAPIELELDDPEEEEEEEEEEGVDTDMYSSHPPCAIGLSCCVI
jgi:hypothetical protein